MSAWPIHLHADGATTWHLGVDDHGVAYVKRVEAGEQGSDMYHGMSAVADFLAASDEPHDAKTPLLSALQERGIRY